MFQQINKTLYLSEDITNIYLFLWKLIALKFIQRSNEFQYMLTHFFVKEGLKTNFNQLNLNVNGFVYLN